MVGFPEVTNMSLEVIKKINSYGIPVEILTKGVFPKEIINVSSNSNNIFGITLVSLNEEFRKQYEPNTSPYSERINSLKMCHDNGLKTWVSIEPYPTPNICEQSLINLLEEIAFVDYIVFGRWNYNKNISSFSDHKSFYNKQCEIIEKFCKDNNIKLHIKDKTKTSN